MVGRLFDAQSQATKAMINAKRDGNKSNFAIAMQIENALMNTAKIESELQLLYMQTGHIDVWNKIKAKAAEMDRDDAQLPDWLSADKFHHYLHTRGVLSDGQINCTLLVD